MPRVVYTACYNVPTTSYFLHPVGEYAGKAATQFCLSFRDTEVFFTRPDNDRCELYRLLSLHKHTPNSHHTSVAMEISLLHCVDELTVVMRLIACVLYTLMVVSAANRQPVTK